MRFRPANISLINHRHYLPRLLLTLSSKRQIQKPHQRFEDVDRVTPYQVRVARYSGAAKWQREERHDLLHHTERPNHDALFTGSRNASFEIAGSGSSRDGRFALRRHAVRDSPPSLSITNCFHPISKYSWWIRHYMPLSRNHCIAYHENCWFICPTTPRQGETVLRTACDYALLRAV